MNTRDPKEPATSRDDHTAANVRESPFSVRRFPYFRAWTTEREGTRTWHGRFKCAPRSAVEWHIHRHRGHLPDRWVVQVNLIHDRKWRDE